MLWPPFWEALFEAKLQSLLFERSMFDRWEMECDEDLEVGLIYFADVSTIKKGCLIFSWVCSSDGKPPVGLGKQLISEGGGSRRFGVGIA